MADGDKFCVRCGAMIPEGSSFCGECGLQIEREPSDAPDYEDCRVKPKCKGLGPVPALIILYGILAIASSLINIWFFSNFDNNIAALTDFAMQLSEPLKTQWLELVNQIVSMYPESVRIVALVLSFILLASGISALISGYYANECEKWKLSFYLCVAATVLSLGNIPPATTSPVFTAIIIIFLVAVGAYMSYRIYQSKYLFKS